MRYIVQYSAGVTEIREDMPDNPCIIAFAPLPDDYQDGDRYDIQNGVAIKIEPGDGEIIVVGETMAKSSETFIREAINQI